MSSIAIMIDSQMANKYKGNANISTFVLGKTWLIYCDYLLIMKLINKI